MIYKKSVPFCDLIAPDFEELRSRRAERSESNRSRNQRSSDHSGAVRGRSVDFRTTPCGGSMMTRVRNYVTVRPLHQLP